MKGRSAMGVTNVRSGSVAASFGDPIADAEMALVELGRERRAGAVREREAAYEAQDRELEQAERDQRTAADWRLASGLLQGGLQIAEGAVALDRAGIDARRSQAEQSASRRSEQLRSLDHAEGAGSEGESQRPTIQSALDRDNRSVAELRSAGARQEFRGQVVAGGRQAIGAALDRVASQLEGNAAVHNRLAQGARRRADAANDTAQDANASAQRIEGRAEEAVRERTQARLQMINATRA